MVNRWLYESLPLGLLDDRALQRLTRFLYRDSVTFVILVNIFDIQAGDCLFLSQ